ncbi:MAG: hypothetical protein HYZ22_16480 [Chloroflexi bacterium]|nr:hypothetical protein [Chloroflexota bacterium]
MKADFEKFIGTLPYASELFGIYQPLIGWKSKRSKTRLRTETRENFSALSAIIKGRSAADASSQISIGKVYEESPIRLAAEIDSLVARRIAERLNPANKPSQSEWRQLINVDEINKILRSTKTQVKNYAAESSTGVHIDSLSYLNRYLQSYVGGNTQDVSSTATRSIRNFTFSPLIQYLRSDPSQLSAFTQSVLDKEKRVSQALLWLAENMPSALNQMFYRTGERLADMARMIDPAHNFGAETVEAVLSPIGMIHIFRQYFFEFDTFLGPSVGHVWISPGGTVELIEISTRKVLTDRTFETSLETTSRAEKEIKIQDELSDAVKDENQNNIKFGFGASAKYSTVVFEAEGNTSLDYESSRTSARETTHKQMREQSEKLSEEIKRSFKSTFRVSTEVEEASSKRYVIQNTTDKLVNYELRRKMRQVGVQVQDIDMQLCWQVFVDDPGHDLGIAKLVHIAQPADLSSLQPPEAPVVLQRKPVEVMVQFPYENTPDSEGNEMDVTFTNGDDGEGGWFSNNDKIVWQREFQAEPPAPGYAMDSHIDFQVNHSSTVAATVERVNAQGKFKIILNQVNFDGQPFISFKIVTYWNPPDQSTAEAAYQTKMAEYNAEKVRLEKEAYVKAAQERVEAASRVSTRKFEDLREEERVVVYRKLISQLMNVNQGGGKHMLSEMVRSIFDVDGMLYFVAPEWWRPRLHQSHQTFGTSQPITEESVVSWGGSGENREDNYFITDESEPARLGSSLGWLLQLDGDNFRNAFLNSPWVKAVVPIRPGKELEAMKWLEKAHVEGSDGLDAEYKASPEELIEIAPDGSKVTVREALEYLAKQIQQQHGLQSSPQPSPFEPNVNILPAEVVYEHGFNPLSGGIKVDERPFRVFSQWIEVLPTDQIVALDYNAEDHL